MLKETGAQEWVFEELKSMDIANFYNKNKSDPMNYVVEMAENLHDYIPEKVITGPCLRIEFDKSTIDSLFSYLTPQNLQIYLISSTFDKSTFLTEEIYGTLYHREKIPAPLINLLENPGKTPESLNLPLKNDFIPTEFHVLSSESDQIPQLLAENSKYTLWHMQDTEFNVDKIYAKVMLHCNDYGVNDIAFFNLLSRIWVDVFNHKFAETDYLANLAGLKLNLTVENYGLDVGLFGYSQKFDVFLIEFFGQLASFGISFEDREIFEIYLKKMKDGINNYFVSSPLNQATNIVNDIVNVNCHFSYEDKQKAVEKINFEHLLFFSGQFLTNIRHEWFIIGNIDKYRASLIVDSAVLTLEINRKINYVTKDEYPSLRVLEIPAIMTDISKSTSNYLVNHLDLTNPNSAVISIFQIGPETLKSQSAVLILANYLREPSFDTLRTKEQLGYSVSVMSRKIRSCMFFSINVQSAVKSCAYVTSRISAFIDSMKTKIQAMTDDEYSEVKNSALKRHSKKEISLTEKYDKFNLEIIRGSYWFNRKEDIEIELKNMSKQEFVEFFMDTFYNRQARIDIEVISENLKSENSTLNSENHREVIRSVDEYKRKQNVFRQSYIKS